MGALAEFQLMLDPFKCVDFAGIEMVSHLRLMGVRMLRRHFLHDHPSFQKEA